MAGATGALGRQALVAAKRRGLTTRALVRRVVEPSAIGADEVVVADAVSGEGIERALQGVSHVFSALGASVSPEFGRGRKSFLDVDTPANTNLVVAARSAGVHRFCYVSVACHEELAHLRYVSAHEAVVQALRASGLSYAVLRPTGFFSAFGAVLELARKGPVPVLGPGTARTNPIADQDLAELALDLLEDEASTAFERTVGGPVTHTRREIVELAFRALGAPVRTRSLPDALIGAVSALSRPFNPRVADLMLFYRAVSSLDCIGAPCGTRRLEDHFTACARPESR